MTIIIELLRQSGALLEGHFQLSSGRHSDRYFQCSQLFQYPDRAKAVLSPVVRRLKADQAAGILKIDAVVGPAIGGIIVAYELGRQLELPAFFTERDSTGRMVLRRGFNVEAGMQILIAEDVVTTGKSSAECAAVLKAAGAKIVAQACVIDRRVCGVRLDWPLYPAIVLEAGNWEPDDCQLCAKGVAIVKPGSRH